MSRKDRRAAESRAAQSRAARPASGALDQSFAQARANHGAALLPKA